MLQTTLTAKLTVGTPSWILELDLRDRWCMSMHVSGWNHGVVFRMGMTKYAKSAEVYLTGLCALTGSGSLISLVPRNDENTAILLRRREFFTIHKCRIYAKNGAYVSNFKVSHCHHSQDLPVTSPPIVGCKCASIPRLEPHTAIADRRFVALLLVWHALCDANILSPPLFVGNIRHQSLFSPPWSLRPDNPRRLTWVLSIHR